MAYILHKIPTTRLEGWFLWEVFGIAPLVTTPTRNTIYNIRQYKIQYIQIHFWSIRLGGLGFGGGVLVVVPHSYVITTIPHKVSSDKSMRGERDLHAAVLS